jgi:hypothetical protein
MNPFASVAVWGFWILLALGWWLGELQLRGTALFIALWLAVFLGSGLVFQGLLFLPAVAVLDIALVFTVFKGDVTLR